MMNSFKTPKGTELPIMNIKGKPYLQVVHRLIWFREEHPDWGIKTTVKMLNDEAAIGYAEITDSTGRIIATGHKYEDRKGFADYFEKCETSAIGRALALCGYGTQFATDLDEGDRLADAPITRSPVAAEVIPTNRNKAPTGDNYITDKQVGFFYGQAFRKGAMDRNNAEKWLLRNTNNGNPSKILQKDFDSILRRLETTATKVAVISENGPPPHTDDDLPF